MPYLSTTGISDRKTIQKELDKDLKKYLKKGFQGYLKNNQTNDTIIYFLKNNIEALKVTYVFKDTLYDWGSDNFCKCQIFEFDCSPCAEKHIKEATNDYGFRELASNHFLSNYTWKTELKIIQDSTKIECLTFIFKHCDKPKQEYNLLYKSLKKK